MPKPRVARELCKPKSLSMPKELWAKLSKEAGKRNMRLSQFIRHVLETYFRRNQ